jgi:hypothetical protein
MLVVVRANGRGFEIRVVIQWQALIAFSKAALATIAIMLVLMQSQAVAQIVQWLGG